eukprot:1196241-Prorocentrum_minimum.AAC.5
MANQSDAGGRSLRTGYILTSDQSDAGRAHRRQEGPCGRGIFSRRTNRMQDARVYSHDGPIGRSTRSPTPGWSLRTGYILTTDQSDAGHAGIFSQRTNRDYAWLRCGRLRVRRG